MSDQHAYGQLQPRSAYVEQVQAGIDEARRGWAEGGGRMLWLLLGFGFVLVNILAAILVLILLGGIPGWLAQIVVLFALGVPLVLCTAGWQMTSRLLVEMCYDDVALDCPHCLRAIDLKRPWQCGWCNLVNNTNMVVAPHLVLDGCSHKAHHAPTAIRCPHCDYDIVRDEAAYQTQLVAGPRAPDGIADFRIRDLRMMPGDSYRSIMTLWRDRKMARAGDPRG